MRNPMNTTIHDLDARRVLSQKQQYASLYDVGFRSLVTQKILFGRGYRGGVISGRWLGVELLARVTAVFIFCGLKISCYFLFCCVKSPWNGWLRLRSTSRQIPCFSSSYRFTRANGSIHIISKESGHHPPCRSHDIFHIKSSTAISCSSSDGSGEIYAVDATHKVWHQSTCRARFHADQTIKKCHRKK